jgi:DNA-binding SARP family transcriptional activator/Tfp pilus assembly protein PilF
MATEIEFCLLGPLMVRCGGALVPVPAGKQRAVLAALLLNGGRVVSLDELAEVLWGPGPPPSARVAVQNYVMRLRKALGRAAGSRISTRPRGYVIAVDAGELDVTRFEAYLDAARAAARDSSWDIAAAQAGAGLSLWRGDPLADVESELLAVRDVPHMAEIRLQALETRIDADLHLGRHGEVITELRQLTRADPLRERLHGMLMLALYRDGRQAEALAAYQHARQILVEELGAEPGAALRELHQQMLTGTLTVDGSPPEPPATGQTAPAVPRELPARVSNFTGRSDELQTLSRLLAESGEKMPGTVVISAIGGTAGVGKTALAVHWARQVAERFPDGQLYVNLRGYDPDRPVTAADALAGFLRALGVPGQDIPAEEAERAARYRSLLAGRRVLVVLDNAGSVEQVRPLLPGSPACAALVTSRDALAGLVARDGAARLDLDVLPLADAVSLLQALIGQRASADHSATADLAAQCCRLPLALRVAAELAAARPDVPVASLVEDLADQQQRLDLLDAGGDPHTAVRTVFSWSYRHLDAGAARAFRLAGLQPGPDVDSYAAAALIGATQQQGRRVLGVLARAHLIQQAGPGRYGMHDLLRAYARSLADAHDGDKEQHAALTRLFDYYLHTAATAMDALYPAERHHRPRIPPPATPAPPVTDPAAARAWLDAERSSLVADTVHTAEHGWLAHATQLAATLFRYLDTGRYCPEAITIYGHACTAARRAGDRAAEATALTCLAGVHWQQSRYRQAADHLQQALDLFRQTGDRVGQAQVLSSLGVTYTGQGSYRAATSHLRQALDLFRQTSDHSGEARALGNLGDAEERQGRYEQAARHHQQSLAIAQKIGDQHVECTELVNLGTVGLRQGHYQQAAGHLYRALALSRETSYRYHQAEALTRIGDVCLQQGRPHEAADHLQQALALYREIGERSGEADALNSLGEALLATGQPGDARTRHIAALGLADQIGDKRQQARAHHGLAHACQGTGDAELARHHWQQALALYTELGVPEAEQVRAQLAAAEDREHREP